MSVKIITNCSPKKSKESLNWAAAHHHHHPTSLKVSCEGEGHLSHLAHNCPSMNGHLRLDSVRHLHISTNGYIHKKAAVTRTDSWYTILHT